MGITVTRALIAGHLHGRAEDRSKAGRPQASATMSLDGGGLGPSFAGLTARDGVATRLLALDAGDPLAVVGRLEVSVYSRDGREHEARVRVLVEELVALPLTRAAR